MKCPPLTQLNGVFGVIKPRGLTAAKTCNRIRRDLITGIWAFWGHFIGNCFIIYVICFIWFVMHKRN